MPILIDLYGSLVYARYIDKKRTFKSLILLVLGKGLLK